MSKYQKIDKIDGIYIFQSYKKPLRTKIYDLEKENKILRSALELTCYRIRPYEIIDNGFAISVYEIMNKYILQAKKEMEECF